MIRVWGKSQKGKKEKGEREQEGGGEERKKRQHGAECGMSSSAGILDQSRKNCSSNLGNPPVVWFSGPAYKPTCIFRLTSTPRQSSESGRWRSASEYQAKTYWGAVSPLHPYPQTKLESYLYYYYFVTSCSRQNFPDQGSNLHPLKCKHRIITTRSPGTLCLHVRGCRFDPWSGMIPILFVGMGVMGIALPLPWLRVFCKFSSILC